MVVFSKSLRTARSWRRTLDAVVRLRFQRRPPSRPWQPHLPQITRAGRPASGHGAVGGYSESVRRVLRMARCWVVAVLGGGVVWPLRTVPRSAVAGLGVASAAAGYEVAKGTGSRADGASGLLVGR